MLIEKEKVIAEIDKRVEGLLSFRKSWADDEANSLNELKIFLKDLPAVEEVEMWAVYYDGYKPNVFASKESAEFSVEGTSRKPVRVFIRRAE